MRFRLLLVLFCLAIPARAANDPAIDLMLAKRSFEELRAMCAADRGERWGISLCGPTLFVEPSTRAVVTNVAGTKDVLPKEIGVANMALEWDGRLWTMVMWPLPQDAYARKVLLAHESFHRIQKQLGFPSTGPSNAHLDTPEGRTLLQLEWRALGAALQARGTARTRAVGDALAFRAERRAKFPSAAADERSLEMHEGLAEYTGTAFAAPSLAERIPHLVKALRDAESTPSFVRSFAYTSGPAYGALLEAGDPRWTRKLKPSDDLGALLGVAPSPAVDPGAYAAATLRATEAAREEQRQLRLRAFQARYVDGPTLVIPLANMRMEFDPNAAQPFPGHGTVYPTIILRDDWGTITVTAGGALISADYTTLTVPAPPSADYTLTLTDGWELGEGQVRKHKH
jgi:hypothetical protein